MIGFIIILVHYKRDWIDSFMQEKHSLSEQCIIEYLKLYYHIEVHTLTFIPLGADSNALLYKADTPDHSYFIKFRYGLHEDINITIMKLLHNAGLKHIILPTLTTQGQSIQPIGDNLTLLVYPFIAGENAFSHCLTDTQWRIVGKALRQLHEIQVPPAIQQRLRQEAYSPKWREKAMLAYYRHERIVEDIALFGKSLLCSTSGGETRAESYKHFKAMFAPNGVVDIAFRTDES